MCLGWGFILCLGFYSIYLFTTISNLVQSLLTVTCHLKVLHNTMLSLHSLSPWVRNTFSSGFLTNIHYDFWYKKQNKYLPETPPHFGCWSKKHCFISFSPDKFSAQMLLLLFFFWFGWFVCLLSPCFPFYVMAMHSPSSVSASALHIHRNKENY